MLLKVFGLGAMRYAPEGDGVAPAGSGGPPVGASGDGAPGGGGPPDLGTGQGAPPPAAAPDWRESIPQEYSQEKVWEPYAGKPLGEVLKAHAEQVKLLGRSITMPGKDAKPEDVAKWKETQLPKLVAAGLVAATPSAPDKYELRQPDIPHIPPLNERRAEFYKAGFHKLGITQEQAQGLVELNAREMSESVKWADEQNMAAIEGLRETWGDLLFDKKWDKAMSAVDPIAKTAGLEPAKVKEYFDKTRKGNDPLMFQLLAAVGDMISEDVGIGVEVAGVGGPTQARAEIERIEASDAYKHERHPGHADAITRRENLFKLIYGTGKADPANILGR